MKTVEPLDATRNLTDWELLLLELHYRKCSMPDYASPVYIEEDDNWKGMAFVTNASNDWSFEDVDNDMIGSLCFFYGDDNLAHIQQFLFESKIRHKYLYYKTIENEGIVVQETVNPLIVPDMVYVFTDGSDDDDYKTDMSIYKAYCERDVWQCRVYLFEKSNSKEASKTFETPAYGKENALNFARDVLTATWDSHRR
jgi:hypothetical protein